MTDLLIQSSSRSDTFPRVSLDRCSRNVPLYGTGTNRYGEPQSELKHSKSDDLVLENARPILMSGGDRCAPPVQKATCVVYEDESIKSHVLPKTKYYSDSETDVDIRPKRSEARREYNNEQQMSSRHAGLYDRVDPEDSIRDMVTENDFYRFVLFKRHYEKYLHLSQKYEEARNIAYYLEEKYHEIKAERDGLSQARVELERKLETKELQLHEKEEELFLQLEKAVRLEEDCEKLRAEKEKFGIWKDKLEKEKNAAYKQLKCQASESEVTRRGLERARQEVVRQVTAISAEKENLERENERLKETLSEERKGMGNYLGDVSKQKKRISHNVVGLEKEVTELKYMARQSQSLNNHFKKGMKHLATCKRKKCSVCTYTKATFGEYADREDHKLTGCFQLPFQDLRNWIRPPMSFSDDEANRTKEGEGERFSTVSGGSVFYGHSSPLPSTRSEYSFRRAYSTDTHTSTSSPSPSPSLPLECLDATAGPYISYIDEASTSSESSSDSGHGEESFNALDGPPCHCPFDTSVLATDTSMTSTSSAAAAARAFSSDSGFSSELYDSTRSRGGAKTPGGGLQRSKWTASFRKLINRMSMKSFTDNRKET